MFPKSGNNPHIYQLMDGKTNVEHIYNGILFSERKASSPDTCYRMNEPWKHHPSRRSWSHETIYCCFVQLPRSVRLFATPWTAAHQAYLSLTISWSLPKFMSIELVMASNHLILCCTFLLPSIFPSIRVFSNESVLCIKWPKYWSFNFSNRPSNEYSGLISFRMDWLDLLAVQGTLMSLLQQHNSKASVLWRSAFFIVQLSRPYMTTEKL